MGRRMTFCTADSDHKLLYALCEKHSFAPRHHGSMAKMVGPGCAVADVRLRFKVLAQKITTSNNINSAASRNTSLAKDTLQLPETSSTQSTASVEGLRNIKSNNKREATEDLKEDIKRFRTSDVGDPAAEDIIVRLGIRIGKLEETIVEKDKGIAVCGEDVRRLGEDLQKRKEEIRIHNMHMEESKTDSEYLAAKVEDETRKLKKLQKEVMEHCKVSQERLEALKDLETKYKGLQSEHEAIQSKVVKHVTEVRLLNATGLERDKEMLDLQTEVTSMKTKLKTQAEEIATTVEQKNLESKRVDIFSSLWRGHLVTLRNLTNCNEILQKGVANARARVEEELKERQEAEQTLEMRDARIIQLEEGLKTAQGGFKTLLERG